MPVSEYEFEVLIDSKYLEIFKDSPVSQFKNKNILSVINDYEDRKWRYEKFQNYIWDNIVETALTLQERQALSNKPRTQLVAAASNLRITTGEKDKTKGSELAEIILYGIMKDYYGALPVVPKIYYKQNSQDNAKGSDSVHLVLESGSEFSIWFGEAKLYNSIEDTRLDSIVSSVENSLRTDKLKKENSIIVNLSEIDALVPNSDLRDSIKNYLSPKNSIDLLKPKLHVPILLIHECEITKGNYSITEEYKNKIIEYHTDRAHAYFSKQLHKLSASINQYSDITFHLILFPIPEKNKIINMFLETAKSYRS